MNIEALGARALRAFAFGCRMRVTRPLRGAVASADSQAAAICRLLTRLSVRARQRTDEYEDETCTQSRWRLLTLIIQPLLHWGQVAPPPSMIR